MRSLLLRSFLAGGVLIASLGSVAAARYPAAIIKEYSGRHQEAFVTQFERVRLLTRQAQMEVSSRLGLMQYREGFVNPIFIRFADGAPPGVESALAYVQLGKGPQGFVQELVVNLDATAAKEMKCHTTGTLRPSCGGDFDRIFYHEMTHAVLNDVIGGEASLKIPYWVQEGLAQYISEEGRDRVAQAASRYKKSQVHALLWDLDGPYTGRAYPQYYLAIEYLLEKHSVNSIQALVRNLILGKSVIDAVEESTGLSWVKFQDQVRAYSLDVLRNKARPDF